MKVIGEQIEERLPVWEALSEFFLDSELQPDDHERIAQELASSNYSEGELEDILICEVCPVCKWNMLSVAGEWIGFDREWLKEKIGPRYGKRLRFKGLYDFRHRWMYARYWNKIKRRISEIRNMPPLALRTN